jgi:hypothetical protein
VAQCYLSYSNAGTVHWSWKDLDVGLMMLSKSHLPLALDGLASLDELSLYHGMCLCGSSNFANTEPKN